MSDRPSLRTTTAIPVERPRRRVGVPLRLQIVAFDLRLRRRMLIGTAVGAALYLLLIVVMYPSFRHDTSIDAMIRNNPTAAAAFGVNGSITSPAGWLSANMYANFGPLLALLLTIGYGASAIAGQASEGLLSSVATQPYTRGRLVGEKTVALLLVAAVVPAAGLPVSLLGPRYELHPDWAAFLEVTLALTLLALDLGALALAVGALTGSRGAALGVASGAAAATYLVSSLAPAVHWVHTIRWVSPFYWAVGDNQLVDGVAWESWLLLVGVAVALLGAALAVVRRLDVP